MIHVAGVLLSPEPLDICSPSPPPMSSKTHQIPMWQNTHQLGELRNLLAMAKTKLVCGDFEILKETAPPQTT